MVFCIQDKHLQKSFSEAADHPEINDTPHVFLCFIMGQMVPNCRTHHICAFLHFQGTLSYILEINFPKPAGHYSC